MEAAATEQLGDEFLCANLEYLASLNPPTVSPVLPQLPGGAGLLPVDFQPASVVLQVNAVEDVSLPLVQRLRVMVSPEAHSDRDGEHLSEEPLQPTVEEALRSLESNEPSSPRRGRRTRLLRLTLTDGFTRVIALEDFCGGCDALRDGVAWGAKLRLLAPLKIRQGVLILTSEGTLMLGGFVPELQDFWMQRAASLLEEMSGRPKRRVVPSAPVLGASFHASAAASSVVAPVAAHDGAGEVAAEGRQQSASLLPSTLPVPVHNGGEEVLVGSAPPVQPIHMWKHHHPSTVPFATAAVIAEVTSELIIRRGAGRPPSFSLLVLLIGSSSARTGSSGMEDADATLVVDLGHHWLRQSLGMDVDAFCALSASQHPSDVAHLNLLVERVSEELEKFGDAVFLLQQREEDGIIEVVGVNRLQSS